MQLTGARILNGLIWAAMALTGVAAGWELFKPGQTDTLDAFIILLATIVSVAKVTKQLPLQNILFAAAITALIGGAAHGLSAQTGIPFGPLTFGETAGPKYFNYVPWTVPLLWIIAILNSRGVARLILRPWRRVKNYGYILIAITALLALVFDLALEPFAAHVKHLWLWQPTKISITWHGTSPVAFLGWLAVSLLIMAFITPSLIRKQPGAQPPPDYTPAALWFGAIIFFALSAGGAGLWSVVVLDAVLASVVFLFCWRGAKW